MKIAVCFSGFVRFWEESYPAWYEYLLSRHEIDVFVHTWDTVQVKTPISILPDFDSGVTDSVPFDSDKFSSMYTPRSLVVESFAEKYPEFVNKSAWIYPAREMFIKKNPDCDNLRTNRPTANFAMWYTRQAVARLKSQYEQRRGIYDIVLTTRIDFRIDAPFPFDTVDSVVTTGPWPNHSPEPWTNYDEGINDWWAYGPSRLIDGYSNVYDRFPIIADHLLREYDFERVINPHKIPAFNMKMQNVPYVKSVASYGYLFGR